MAIVNVEDARELARRRLPKVFFEYIDGAAFGEETAARNIRDYSDIGLQQRVLVDVSKRSLKASYLGKERPLPFALGPVGFSGLFAEQGEIQAARAAHRLGVPFCLSTFAITSMRALRKATDGPLWFQLYVLTNRALSQRMIDIAKEAQCETLCVTVDVPISGLREKDVRNGFRGASKLTPQIVWGMIQRPGWVSRVLRGGAPSIGNLEGLPEFSGNALQQAGKIGAYLDSSMRWEDVAWIRDAWPGKMVIKGVLHPADAELAVKAGADGIVVSNHGGRQLDGASSTIAILPEIVAAVGSKLDVLMDGGIRRGSHIAKALALGAKGVLLGRAYAYGLAAGGEAGVAAVMNALRVELDNTIAHMGVTDLATLHARQKELIFRR